VALVRRIFAAALLFTLAPCQPAGGQDGPPEPETHDTYIDEIVVTGTRIVRRDYKSSSPIVTIDSSLFEQSGSPSVGTVLNTMPQFTPWMTEYTNNRPGPKPLGQTIMDLRGLGFGRTLVLMDGRRIVPSNGFGSVDVNLIPPAIIQSVEVVTGGASAVYGTDAVAGVINFRTRQFTGLEADASWAQTDVGDGQMWNAGLTGGLQFSRGYVNGHLSVAQRDPIMQGDREFSEVTRAFNANLGHFVTAGSWYVRQGMYVAQYWNRASQSAIDDYFMAVDPSYTAGAISPNFYPLGFNPDGSPFSMSPVYNFTGDLNEPLQPVEPSIYSYNTAPDNFLRLPMDRNNFFGRAGINLGEDVELYAQVHWADYSSRRRLAPAPINDLWIAADNPHIHPGLAAILASRPFPDAPFWFMKRMSDLGPRRFSADYDARQVVAGAKGNLGHLASWTFDLYGTFGRVDQSRTMDGAMSRSAFDELSMASDAGASICGGDGMNPFGINSISAECAAYIRRTGTETAEIRQTVGEATISGPLFDLPAGTTRAALGLLYKKDRYLNVGDETWRAQRLDPVYGYAVNDVDLGGASASEDISGETSSREAFVELNLPLLSNAPMARSLEATLGLRYGDNSNAGTFNAWKADTIWQISGPLTFRSSYQQAIRAPDFYALFSPQTEQTFSWFDGEPCDSTYEPASEDSVQGAQQDPDVAALCTAQGIPEEELANFVDARRFAIGPSGGNPNLAEETAETITAGLVLHSAWDRTANLQTSIDYYHIEVKDIVGYLGNPVFQCFDRNLNPSLDPNNIYCQQFTRNTESFQIDEIRDIALNLSELSISGFDLQVDLGFDAGPGQLHLHGLASYAASATQTAGPGSPQQEYAGKATAYGYNAASPFFALVPRVRASAEAGYALGSYDINVTWRYVGKVQDDWITDFYLPSRQYWGLTVGFSPDSKIVEGLEIRGGVTNLTNTEPVLYPSWVEANTEPSTYDVVGRQYFVRMTYRF
jgi:outer membrane receptor protein involved in Fe transport